VTAEKSELLTESLPKMVSLTKRNSAQGHLTGAALAESEQDIVPQNMLTRSDLPKERQRKPTILAPQQFSQEQHLQVFARLFDYHIWIEYSR